MNLTKSQKEAMDLLLKGQNVFLELREHDTAYFKVTNGLKVFYEGNNCWDWFLDQPANFIYTLLEERRRLNFHMLDGIIGIDKVVDFYTIQKTEY